MWNSDDFEHDELYDRDDISFQVLPVKKDTHEQLSEMSIGKYFFISPRLNKALSLKKTLDPSKTFSEHICVALEIYLKDELNILDSISKQASKID